jgi:hypothetical protein
MGSEPENVQLQDGSRVTIRSVAPRDEASLRSFLAGLCPEARYRRFFSDAALPANRAMFEVFREGFDANVVLRDGVDMVEFPTSAWRMANDRFPTTRLQSRSEATDTRANG